MTPLWSDAIEQRIRKESCSLDEQIRPTEIIQCKTCVITNQRPRIVIDDEGICSACRYAERKRTGIDWTIREKELVDLLSRHRRPRGYDVVVPVSGGKDSSYVAHRLKRDYGMHPLCVKFAPFLYTDIGRKNFEAFVHSGFDVTMGWPNGELHRKLARIAFEYLGDPFQPFAYGQLAYPMKVACDHGIGLVIYGENGEAEYGGDPAANDKPCWGFDDWDRIYLKGNGIGRLLDIGKHLGTIDPEETGSIYRLPKRERMQQRGTQFHWFGYYTKWHPQSNFYYAGENAGFEANPERSEGTYSKYASLDDKMDGLHYFMAYVKFGIGRATSDAAHETRDGDIERDEALALVRKYDGEFPKRYLAECLDYLGMDETRLWDLVERFRGERVILRQAA